MAVYEYGSVARITGDFYYIDNNTKVFFDPTGVTVSVKNPDGTVTDYVYGTDSEVVKSTTGKYYMDVECDMAGRWLYRFVGTGARQTAEETHFNVLESEF